MGTVLYMNTNTVTARKSARIIASLRDDRLSVRIGARSAESFIEAYDGAVAVGVQIPADLVTFRSTL